MRKTFEKIRNYAENLCLGRKMLLALLWCYQNFLSPWKPQCCRFYPSCSSFAVTAVRRFGCLKGSWLTLCRILRCHPFNHGPSYDPVPPLQCGMSRSRLNKKIS